MYTIDTVSCNMSDLSHANFMAHIMVFAKYGYRFYVYRLGKCQTGPSIVYNKTKCIRIQLSIQYGLSVLSLKDPLVLSRQLHQTA